MFIDDNSKPHCVHNFDGFLKEGNICRVNWLSRFSYLNPIEHVWDALGNTIAQPKPSSKARQGLKAALLENLALLPQAFIDTLMNRMGAFCLACTVVHGDHISY